MRSIFQQDFTCFSLVLATDGGDPASKAYRRSHVDELAKLFEQFRVDHRIPSNLLSVPELLLTIFSNCRSFVSSTFFLNGSFYFS